MNILLALDSANGINSFEQFCQVGIPIGIALLLWLVLYILPSYIISNAIKKLNSPTRFRIIKEYNDCFRLDNDVMIYKKWYDDKYDLYECPYGYYIPIYNYEKDIVAFVYERKSR